MWKKKKIKDHEKKSAAKELEVADRFILHSGQN